LATLRAAIANGGVPDTYANGFTRYAAREYPISLMDSGYYATAVKRGIPAKFVSLDSSFNSNHHLTVANRAAHPNAAKLLAAVLVGPEGQRIAENAIGTGNRFYESSAEYRLEQEARAAGLPDFSWAQPAGVELARSPRAPELRKQIDDILNGG
jgi:ABC-type Fe3+ transport system substrate-binding protein